MLQAYLGRPKCIELRLHLLDVLLLGLLGAPVDVGPGVLRLVVDEVLEELVSPVEELMLIEVLLGR